MRLLLETALHYPFSSITSPPPLQLHLYLLYPLPLPLLYPALHFIILFLSNLLTTPFPVIHFLRHSCTMHTTLSCNFFSSAPETNFPFSYSTKVLYTLSSSSDGLFSCTSLSSSFALVPSPPPPSPSPPLHFPHLLLLLHTSLTQLSASSSGLLE